MDILDLEHQDLNAGAGALKIDPEIDSENEYDLVTLNYLVLLDAIRQGRPAGVGCRRA